MLNNLSPVGRRAAWGVFDADWYLSRYPDVKADMAALDIADPECYHWTHGCRQGHSANPFFDEAWYSKTYRDVADKLAAGLFDCGFAHYLAVGFADRSPHWLFSDSYYLAGNLDLTRSRLEDGGFCNSYDHYLARGDAEFRSGHLYFNPGLYAGAFTTTPGLAAGQEALRHTGATTKADEDSMNRAAFAYSVTYPFGVVGPILVIGFVVTLFLLIVCGPIEHAIQSRIDRHEARVAEKKSGQN